MGSSKIWGKVIILVVILLNIGCDQVTKSIARRNLDYHQTIPVIKGRFNLIKVENYGAFLSSGDQLPIVIKFILLSLFPLLVLLYGLYFLMSKKDLHWLFALGISFVIGGGVGNLYDRFIHGSVTDFMHVDFILFQTGVFNVADLSIMAGMCMVLFHLYFSRLVSTRRNLS